MSGGYLPHKPHYKVFTLKAASDIVTSIIMKISDCYDLLAIILISSIDLYNTSPIKLILRVEVVVTRWIRNSETCHSSGMPQVWCRDSCIFLGCFRTSWEFPEIVSGKFNMISDADGKQYPWYGAKRELSQLDGPCNKQSLTLEMNDNFFPQVISNLSSK